MRARNRDSEGKPPPRRRCEGAGRRRIIFRLLSVLLIPLLLLTAEGMLRLRRKWQAHARGTVFWTEPDEYLGYRLKRNFFTPDGRAFINAAGIRGDTSHLPEARGRPRVLVIGNSCAFGAGCYDTEVFSFLLEKKLRSEGWPEALVFNAGVGGYNSAQVRVYLERELWNFRPTDVVGYVGWNDLVTATWPFYVPNVQLGPAFHRNQPFSLMAKLFDKSELLYLIRSRWRHFNNRYLSPKGGTDVWNEKYIRDFERNVDAMVGDARKHGAEIYFIIPPMDLARHPRYYSLEGYSYSDSGFFRLWERFRRILVSAVPRDHIIDLPAALEDSVRDTDVIYDYNHLGPRGHIVASEEIYRVLTRNWRKRRGRAKE